MRRRTASAAALLLALALLLAGCGGSGGGSTSTTSQAPGSARRCRRWSSRPPTSGFDAARVYREAAPGVVTIRSIFGAKATAERRRGLGLRARHATAKSSPTPTWSPTNRGGKRKPAKAVFVEFPDRNVVPAKILGFDPFADVALLKVTPPDGLHLHPLELGNDHDLVVGQPVAAIGSPFGEQHSLSVGVISATDRSVKSLTQFEIEGAIQTDASINPGNSGGPLLNADAQVVGINQQIETELRRQRRGRLRGPDLGGQALDRPAAARRARPNTPTSGSPARRSTRSSPQSSASPPTSAG